MSGWFPDGTEIDPVTGTPVGVGMGWSKKSKWQARLKRWARKQAKKALRRAKSRIRRRVRRLKQRIRRRYRNYQRQRARQNRAVARRRVAAPVHQQQPAYGPDGQPVAAPPPGPPPDGVVTNCRRCSYVIQYSAEHGRWDHVGRGHRDCFVRRRGL